MPTPHTPAPTTTLRASSAPPLLGVLGCCALVALVACDGRAPRTTAPWGGATATIADLNDADNLTPDADTPDADTPDTPPDTPPAPLATLTGTFTFEDRPFSAAGFAPETTTAPARNLLVELLRGDDPEPVARAITDERGAFSLTVPLTDAPLSYHLRGVAALEVGPWTAAVQDRTAARARYAVEQRDLTVLPGDTLTVDLHAAADLPPGGAVNIVDTLGVALRATLPFDQRDLPDLTVRWQPGLAFDCGSCYQRSVISLGAQPEDTDEYDDDIILHEFGHHFIRYFSHDDSPGGSHRDRLVSPTLAYGEGVAYFLAALWTDHPVIEDNFIDATRAVDLEALTLNGDPEPAMRGTSNGLLSGRQREELSASILWDAYDPDSPAEPFDTTAIGLQGHMAVLLSGLGDPGPAADLGPEGTDITDWIAAAACLDPTLLPDLQPVLTEVDLPTLPDLTPACAGKGHDRLIQLTPKDDRLWIVPTPEHPDPQAPSRWLLHTSPDTPPLPIACPALPCALPLKPAPDTRAVLTPDPPDPQRPRASWLGAQALQAWLLHARPLAPAHTPTRAWPSR